LRDEVEKIEEQMAQTEDEIQDQEMYLGKLRGKMGRLSSKDALYVSESFRFGYFHFILCPISEESFGRTNIYGILQLLLHVISVRCFDMLMHEHVHLILHVLRSHRS
jgi:hypothetical protein